MRPDHPGIPAGNHLPECPVTAPVQHPWVEGAGVFSQYGTAGSRSADDVDQPHLAAGATTQKGSRPCPVCRIED